MKIPIWLGAVAALPSFFHWLDQHSGSVQAITSIVLAILTAIYVVFTRSMVTSSEAATHQASEAMTRAATLEVMVDMFREYRSDPRIVTGRRLMGEYRNGLRPAPRTSSGYRAFPPELVALSHYLDNMGALVINEIISPQTVQVFIGEAVVYAWECFRPYCEEERRIRADPERNSTAANGVPYQMNFEYLALTLERMAKTPARTALLEDLEALRPSPAPAIDPPRD